MGTRTETLAAYAKRWNINLEQIDTFQHFQNRLIRVLQTQRSLLHTFDSREFIEKFSFLAGIKPDVGSSHFMYDDLGLSGPGYVILTYVEDSKTARELGYLLQMIFKALEEIGKMDDAKKLSSAISQALDSSLHVPFEVINIGTSFSIYPPGARELDDALISEVASWLDEEPISKRHLVTALQMYWTHGGAKRREILDNLRMAVESLTRFVLGKANGSLENLKKDLLKWISVQGVQPQITNMYETLLSHFALYQNENVKHGDKSLPVEVEFILYLSGSFMRFLLQLRRASAAPSGVSKSPQAEGRKR